MRLLSNYITRVCKLGCFTEGTLSEYELRLLELAYEAGIPEDDAYFRLGRWWIISGMTVEDAIRLPLYRQADVLIS